MCVAIVGGVKGIEREYKQMMKIYGLKCKIFNKKVPDFKKRIQNVDALILLTNTVSHKLSTQSLKVCRDNKILLKRTHSSSLTKLEQTIKEIKNDIK